MGQFGGGSVFDDIRKTYRLKNIRNIKRKEKQEVNYGNLQYGGHLLKTDNFPR